MVINIDIKAKSRKYQEVFKVKSHFKSLKSLKPRP